MINKLKPYNLKLFTRSSIIFLLGLACLVFLTGYTYGKHDQALYIPLAQKVLDPSLYTKDLFSSLIHNESANFLKLIAPLLNLVGIEATFFILFYIGLAILVISAFLIGKSLFNNNNAGYLFSLIILCSKTPLINFETFFATRSLVVPVLIFAIYLFLRKKYGWSYFLIGLMASTQQIFGLSMLAIVLLTNLILIKQIGIKTSIKSSLLFFVGFMPTIFSILQGTSTKIVLTTDVEWYNFQRILIDGAYNLFYPGNEQATAIQMLLTLSTIFLSYLIFKTLKYVRPEQVLKFKIIATLILSASLFLASTAVIYRVYPAVVLVQLQLMRSISLLTLLALIGISILIYIYYTNKLITKSQIVVAFTLLYSGALVVFGAFLLACKYKILPKFLYFFLVPVALSFLIYIFLTTRGFVYGLQQRNLYNVNMQFEGMASWVKLNTPKDAYILAPTYLDDASVGNMRISTQRNIFFTPSELWMNVIDYKGYPLLKQKLNDLSGGKFDLATKNLQPGELFYWTIYKAYIDLTPGQVINLQKKYNLDYFITESEYKYDFEVVYQNTDWVVWKLPN